MALNGPSSSSTLTSYKKKKLKAKRLLFSVWISIFTNSHLECFPSNAEVVLVVWEEAAGTLDLQAAGRQVAWETQQQVGDGGQWDACGGVAVLTAAHPLHPRRISAAQLLHVRRHSQLGFLQIFRASGFFSGEHPRLSCRAGDTHRTVLSITPSPQLAEHWRDDRLIQRWFFWFHFKLKTK